MHKGHIPTRTCVACRARRDKNMLIRFTLDELCRVVRDEAGVRGGRGAYVCRNGSCLEKLKTGDRLRKALKTTFPAALDPEIRIE